jgi:hypothetical protein
MVGGVPILNTWARGNRDETRFRHVGDGGAIPGFGDVETPGIPLGPQTISPPHHVTPGQSKLAV